MRTRSLLATTVLIAVLTAACAGGADDPADPAGDDQAASASPAAEEPPSPEEFAAEADEICIATAKSFVENDARYKANTTRKQSKAIEAEGVALVRQRLEALQELVPPEDLQSQWDEYMDLRAKAVRSFEAVNAAFNKDDKKAHAKASAKLDTHLTKLNETGKALGLFACANTLPPAEVREVKSTVITYFTKLGTCNRLTTKALLKAIGPGKCASGLIASKKVKVKSVDGVEGVRASAVVVPDAYGKRAIAVQLLYEDGTYKVHGYEAE